MFTLLRPGVSSRQFFHSLLSFWRTEPHGNIGMKLYMERDSGSSMSGTLINVGWQANDVEQIIKLLWSCFFLWPNEKSWVESHQLREVSLNVEILSYRSWMEGSGWHHLSNLSITQSRAVRHFWPLKWHDTMYVTLPEKSSCQKIGQSSSQAPGPTHQLSGNNGIEEHVEGCQGSENTASQIYREQFCRASVGWQSRDGWWWWLCNSMNVFNAPELCT